MEETDNVYVLDTSAILTLRDNESGADRVEAILRKASEKKVTVYVSFMSMMETYYQVWREEGEASAKMTYGELKTLPINIVTVEEAILLEAGRIKANYQLSVADAWIVALAIKKKAKLVHKDPEFEQIKKLVVMDTLPYKKVLKETTAK